jgi:alanine racemase
MVAGIAGQEMASNQTSRVKLFARVFASSTANSAGDRMGYNGTFICPAAFWIGTISFGYADGYLRAFQGTVHRNA